MTVINIHTRQEESLERLYEQIPVRTEKDWASEEAAGFWRAVDAMIREGATRQEIEALGATLGFPTIWHAYNAMKEAV